MKKIIATCHAGNTPNEIGKFDSVKEAKKLFKAKLQIGKSVFVAGIGYVTLNYAK